MAGWILGGAALLAGQARVAVFEREEGPKDSGEVNYVLGPGDRIAIWVQEGEEFSGKTFRVEQDGEVRLPLVGQMKAAGLRVGEFEEALRGQLAVYLRQPTFSVTVTDYSSQPVTVSGMVARPGTYQLRGTRTLLEILNEAGGLREEAASYVRITRMREQGVLPLAAVVEDPSGKYAVGEVNVSGLLSGEDTSQNIELRPRDFISVPRVQQVFVIGQVSRQGNIQVSEREGTTVLEAIALAGGLTSTAKPSEARILRPILGGPKRAELAVDLRALLEGRASDLPLLPSDILYVPESAGKKLTARMLDSMLNVAMTSLLWVAMQ